MSRYLLVGKSGRDECRPREPLVLGLDVDCGQDRPSAHASQQVDAGCAAASADLHDRSRTYRRGHEAERCAGQRANRCGPAYLGGVPASADERVVLGQEVVDVAESAGRDGNGYLPVWPRRWSLVVPPGMRHALA